ncbi:hypothetical protein [Atlantibacter sp.]|uniref:hypothetical protein n=1 Tax=Atlantibacter sp. TaxID=1903473 RepID=UPI0028A7A13E|nr:hypothetical protein [Atlantibacter sp.]
MRKLMLLLLIFVSPLWASKYPIISSISTKYKVGGAEYTITQKILEIGPSADQIVPETWVVGLAHKHYDYDGQESVAFTGSTIMSTGYDAIGSLAIRNYNNGSAGVTIIYHGGPNVVNKECVAYVGARSSTIQTSWANAMVPGGCMMVPPADEWCKITTPEITLDHGTIILKNAEGHSATAQMGVYCTTPTAVTFNLVTDSSYVYLDEGKSEITVNNLPLKTKIDLPDGDSTMPIKDLLTGVNSEGYHTGSSILVMMPY